MRFSGTPPNPADAYWRWYSDTRHAADSGLRACVIACALPVPRLLTLIASWLIDLA